MKILFIGLGSAGQRHLRNVKKILGDQAEIAAYRVRNLKRVFDDSMKIVPGQSVEEFFGIREYYDLEDALGWKPDITIISNPNSMHLECAIRSAQAGSDLFIEKPLANSFKNVGLLRDLVEKKGLKAYVGYQNRFHPCVRMLKDVIEGEKLGRIIAVHCEIGELLTGMHSYEDYRGMNESQKSTGGGVVLCQIHELDYLYWLFGMPKELFSIGGKNSRLDIDVEDHAVTLCRYQREGYEFPVTIQQDFLQSPPVRTCKVIGEYGRVEIDLLKNECTLRMADHEAECHTFPSFTRNDMFVEEMKMFLQCVASREREFINIEDGLASLRFALAIKESMKNKATIRFQEEEV